VDLDALRRRAVGAAYRMLGSHSDAEDVAQETLLRVQAAIERGGVRDAAAYTTTVATRLAIDHLRSARVRREAYHGPWLPEPIIERSPDPVELADSLSFGLLVVLETLGPVERAAFLLHDAFDFAYREIAGILGRSEVACRQIVARARRRVADGRPRLPVDPTEHRELLDRFLAAAGDGDLTGLMDLLTTDVVLVTDGGGVMRAARVPICGAERVARFARRIVPKWRDEVIAVTINGEPGFVVERHGRLHLAGTIDVVDGRIDAIRWVLNPAKLQWGDPSVAHSDDRVRSAGT
jgi:RNA polymerase sigma-70 factor (ECF subfamily)